MSNHHALIVSPSTGVHSLPYAGSSVACELVCFVTLLSQRYDHSSPEQSQHCFSMI